MNDPSGSQWRRWDLHFHTPKSFDYGQKSLSAGDVVERLLAAEIAVVAVTDHHVLDPTFIREMRATAGSRLTILPGIEFSCPLGGREGVHFIGIFPEDANLEYLSSELLSQSGVSRMRAEGKPEERIYVDFETTALAIKGLGGIISIHAHGKASSIEGIGNNEALKQEFKKDILGKHIDLLEIGNQERRKDYVETVFPTIGFELPLILGSDDHAREAYPADKCCWVKADPTFAGLRMALLQAERRFCLEAEPESVQRLEMNKTKYIREISFRKLASMPAGEEWLQGEVPLNPGLVAVIGNKGSGKSALADCIGLLGSCTNSTAFSFLEEERFRHPKTGRAQHVEATMHWHDGEPRIRGLHEEIAPDEPERVKYLPQLFVEKVCNDLASPGGGEFEQELKKVVFSKVAPADRLGRHSLDAVVEFRTKELRQEASELSIDLKDLGLERARLEVRLTPSVRTGLEKKIERKKEEIRSHEAAKPAYREAPPEDPAKDLELASKIAELNELKAQRDSILARTSSADEDITTEQLRAATAQKLLDKLENLEKAVSRTIQDISGEVLHLAIDAHALITFTVDRDSIIAIREDAIGKRDEARGIIYGTEEATPGLTAQREVVDLRIREVQEHLSRPQQEFQKFLQMKQEWEEAHLKLLGSEQDLESLAGLEAELRDLDLIPSKVDAIQRKQEEIAQTIHGMRVREAAVYTELYGSVQQFISDHPLASEHLKLEFKVELVEEQFGETLLSFLNQNRVGSFYGTDEGGKMARQLVAPVEWSDWEAVREFLTYTCDHLHHDKRAERRNVDVLLSDQMAKDASVAELYRWLYSLAYINPRYLLRWDGKDVGQLSPGERGTLLLIFYLLVDDSDLPLIIDQPEANLDNVTVAQKLVHCIWNARERRQVIIVTHNPNLAVFSDADQIVHATLDKQAGSRICYDTGALEHPGMNRFTLDVLEGGRSPFDMRDATYRVLGA